MNMAFHKTTEQCRAYLKTVSRRPGWNGIRPAQIIQQVVKGQGLKPGQHPEKIHKIQVIESRWEPLQMLLDAPEYGRHEMIKEGFPGRDPADFVDMFLKMYKAYKGQPLTVTTPINRIDFRYYLSTADSNLTIKIPENIAVCPSCKMALTISPDGWTLMEDGTMNCDSFSHWCASEPEIGAAGYDEFLEGHGLELSMPYIYWLPVDQSIESYLLDTFRFEIGGRE